MTKELKLKLEAQARDYKKKGYSLKTWKDELGWQDWMYLTEGDVMVIDIVLKEIWNDVTVEAIYDTYEDEFIKNNDKEYLIEADAKTKEYIKEQYLFDPKYHFVPRKWLDKACDLEGICEALNLAAIGFFNEKRYIVKKV